MDDERRVIEDGAGMFVGTKRAYEDFKQKHQIVESEEETTTTEKDKTVTQKTVLSKSTLVELGEDTMRMLRRTRCAHDYNEVYMQSALDFYDKYYNESNASPELKAARQIRRIYRSYTDYLTAMNIRNAYIDTLVDKYGEKEFLDKLRLGMLNDWIPPVPVLSKSAEGYDLYLAGVNPLMVCETLPEGTSANVLKSMQDELQDVDLIERCDTETSIGMIKAYHTQEEVSAARSVNISDLEELNQVFKSWYRTQDSTDTKRIMFKNAPENIKKRFLEQCAYTNPGLLTRIMNGEEIEEDSVNLNEMVHDSVTGRTMTRQELMNRETIRILSKGGWSEARLLKYQSVGSMLGSARRKKKASKKRKRNFDDEELVNFYGDIDSSTGIDPMYADNESLMDALNSMMRGD